MKYADGPQAEVELVVDAPIERVWELVTDINLPAQFSSELIGADWVDERRERFVGLRTDAQLQAAELAFELGALDRACDLVNAVLEADPYREAGWRLKMRVAAAFGDDDAVIRTYRDLKRALTEIGAAPASGSRKLLDALRR